MGNGISAWIFNEFGNNKFNSDDSFHLTNNKLSTSKGKRGILNSKFLLFVRLKFELILKLL